MTRNTSIVSIHDVAPHTFDRICQIVDLLHENNIRTYTLLVIPNQNWTSTQHEKLRALTAAGAELAGHGWNHKSLPPKSIRHYLHSKFISRNVAEHYSLSSEEGIQMMCNCHAWFQQNNLPPPKLYVPPAWALGNTKLRDLYQTPFSMVETLQGVYHIAETRMIRLPLLGYEADTLFRQIMLSAFNKLNLLIAKHTSTPIRLSIHPNDLHLRLQNQLKAHLKQITTPNLYPYQ